MEYFKWEVVVIIIGGCGCGGAKKQLFPSIL